MKKIPAWRIAGKGILLCLFFALQTTLSGQTCPPYPRQMDQVFVCFTTNNTLSFEQNATLHNPVRFVFPTFPSDVSVSFNAADGSGDSPVASNEIRSVVYAAPGQYVLWWAVSWVSGYEYDPLGNPVPIISAKTGLFTFQTNFNPSINYNDFLPDTTWNEPAFVGQTYTPPPSNAYPAGSPYNNPVAGDGIVQILYANSDHQLRKPFILVEGFDPIIVDPVKYAVNNPQGETLGYGKLRWDVIVTGRDESFDVDPSEPGVPHTPQFALLPSLIGQIRSRGYDIVYVDFADAGTYIQANAAFLIEVIERVNNEKITSEPNVLIGASMGGIVSRFALAKLESEGKSHCTGLFGTFDTPHNGANIPLALQALGWFYHATGQSDELWGPLNAPAARQQILLNLGAEMQAERVSLQNKSHCMSQVTSLSFDELTDYDYAVLRSTLNNELNDLGWPRFPRKVALLDGMKNGTLPSNQGFAPGTKYYDASIYAEQFNFGTVFKIVMLSNSSTHDEQYTVHGMDNCIMWDCEIQADNTLFTIAQPHDLNPCAGGDVPYKYHIINLECNADLPFTDNAPSGYRTDLSILHSRIKATAEAQNDVEFNNPVYFPVMAFVPTWSSLAMATPLNNTNLFVDLTTQEFEEENLPNSQVPNFDHFYAPEGNLRHVELDGGMVGFILEELDNLQSENIIGNTLAETYNFGLRRTQIPNISVLSGGKLNINNTGPTGYVQSNPGSPAIKPTFTTYLLDCGQTVTVEAGGEYNIGALDKSQHGITEVWQNAIVHIKTGGTLHVTSNQSVLWIKSGATLILDPGAIVNLESAESKILIEGDLVVNGDIDFQGYGYFEFGYGNKLEFGPGVANFRLEGRGIGNRFVRLSANLDVEAGHGVLWSHGKMEAIYNTLIINSGGSCRFNFMEVVGSGPAYDIAVIAADNANLLTFDYCDFNQIGTGLASKNSGLHRFYQSHFTDMNHAVLAEGGSGFFLITDCLFENYPYHEAVFISNRPSLNITNSTWEGDIASTGLDLQQVTQVVMRSSNLNGHASMTGAVNLDGVSYFIMRNSGMSDNEVGINTTTSYLGGTSGIGFEPSNVFMLEGSFIQNGEAGINMLGDATVGLVLMDCSSLLNNDVGVSGTDVILMIDAINAQQHPLDGNEPNSFLRNGWHANTDQYFDICYDQKSPGQPIPMRKNWWAVNDIDTRQFDPEDFMDIRHNDCAVTTLVDVTQALDRAPNDCIPDEFAGPAYPGAGTEAECNVSVSGEVSALGEAWHTAYQQLRLENFEVAEAGFQPIADLWSANLSTYSTNCRQYIQVARAIVDGAGQGSAPRSKDQANKEHPAVSLNPNPSAGLVNIVLPEAVCKVRIWDTYGKLVLETSASNFYRLDVSGWSSGFYWVDVSSPDGKLREYLKMVVQR